MNAKQLVARLLEDDTQEVPAPIDLTGFSDDQIQDQLAEIGADLGWAASAVAELDSEAAHYGDSGPGSGERRNQISQGVAQLQKDQAALRAEWKRRHPEPAEPVQPPSDSQAF